MFACVLRTYGSGDSRFCWRGQAVDLDALAAGLLDAERAGERVCLMGTTFALLSVADTLAARGTRFALPAGSRLMDTGGFKGRTRELPQKELYAAYVQTFGIPEHAIVNEYGMTELSSQYYDRALLAEPGVLHPRRKIGPPWLRAVVVDPETLEPLPPGRPGLVRHMDLANLFSVVAVQTDDLAVLHDDGIELLGRAAGAEARGCSLAMEQLLGG
jgi:hypothetical protein